MKKKIICYHSLQLGDYCAQNIREFFNTMLVGAVSMGCRLCCQTVMCSWFNIKKYDIFSSPPFFDPALFISYAKLRKSALLSLFFVFLALNSRSEEVGPTSSYWRQNETSFVMTGISFFFPTCFEILGLLEKYHPRKQLRFQLGRYLHIAQKFSF